MMLVYSSTGYPFWWCEAVRKKRFLAMIDFCSNAKSNGNRLEIGLGIS